MVVNCLFIALAIPEGIVIWISAKFGLPSIYFIMTFKNFAECIIYIIIFIMIYIIIYNIL